MTLYYVDSFRVKDGGWNTSAIKRDQKLKWEVPRDDNGKPLAQFMEGESVRYPEFMISNNKSNSIEIIFKRKPIEGDILKSFQELIKDFPLFEEPQVLKKPRKNGIAAEITTFDAHIGKLAAEIETGYRNYDLNIAIKDYQYVTDGNLDLIAPHKPEKIFYIVGQDMYHVDNMAGHTTNGVHTLDVDGRITKVHKKAFAVSRDNVYKTSENAETIIVRCHTTCLTQITLMKKIFN
jgi:hypothetical protein